MTTTLECSPAHLVYLPPALVLRMLHRTAEKARNTFGSALQQKRMSFFYYLEAALSCRRFENQAVELRGSAEWFEELVRLACNAADAFEIGKQLAGTD